MEILKIINNFNIKYVTLFHFFLIISFIALACEFSFADPSMQVSSPFHNYHKQDRWLPLNIILNNTSGVFDGEVSSEGDYLYSIPISIFGNTRKSSFLYIYPDNIQNSVNINLKDKKDKIITEKEVQLNIINPEDRLVAIIDNDIQNNFFSDYQSTEKTSETIYFTNIKPEFLPDQWQGYDTIDAVILGNISINMLFDNQKQALIDWICSGGILIVSGGANSQNLKDSFIEELLPVKILETRAVNSIPSLSNKFGYELPENPVVIATSKLMGNGNIIVSEDNGTPVIAERKIGLGKCIFLCFDYGDPIFRSWNGNKGLWKALIPDSIKKEDIKYENVSRLMSSQAHLSLPSYKIIGGFILAYVLCLSIPSYIILKRATRKKFVWILMILVTFAFILCSLGLSYKMKKESFITDLSIIEIYKGFQRAKITSYFCPHSFTKENFDIAYENAIFIKDPASKDSNSYWSGNFSLSQDDIYRLKLSNIRSSASQFLYGELITNFNGNIRLEESVDKARIINDTDIEFVDCILINNGYYAQIKNISSLTKNSIELKDNYSGDIFGVYHPENEMKKKFLKAVKPSLYEKISNKALIGWMDGSALDKYAKIDISKSINLSGMALVIVNL